MKKIKSIRVFLLIMLSFLVIGPVFASDDIIESVNSLVRESEISGNGDVGDVDRVITETMAVRDIMRELSQEIDKQKKTDVDSISDKIEELDGIKVEKINKELGGFGDFIRGLKERILLMFSFNSEKKFKKELKYAEERMLIIDKMVDRADNSKIAKRINKFILKADKYDKIIEKNSNKVLLKIKKEERDRLLLNISRHKLNRQKILDKVENVINVKELAVLQQTRVDVLNRDTQFLNKMLDLKDISRDTLDQIKKKNRDLRVVSESRKKVREEIGELLKKVDEDKTVINKIQEKRKQWYQRKESMIKKEDIESLIEQAKNNDLDAILKLKSFNLQNQKEIRRALNAQKMIKANLENKFKKGDKKVKSRIDRINGRNKRIMKIVNEAIGD